MKAIRYHRYGSPDVLALEEIDRPVIDDDGVLVRVAASSVNALDWHYMRGTPRIARVTFGLRTPKRQIPGVDVAGWVEAVGRNVTSLRPGDEVFGAADGAFAEYVKGCEDDFVPKPAGLTLEESAAIPIAAMTALQALRDKAQLQAGQSVLINGAGGGVGSFAVQIARAFGAQVVAATSTPNVDLVRSIGADRVIDYTTEDFSRGSERYDVILNCGGNRPLVEFRRALAPGGILVIVGADNPLTYAFFSRFHKRMLMFVTRRNKADLLALKAFAEAGKLKPVVDRTFPLEQAAEAIRHVESGQVRGKVVVTV
jgi:NADPH:quinone reductase-like Zn-dependent oxidoreductase